MRIVFQVMPDLVPIGVPQQQLPLRERLPAIELIRSAGVVMREGQVGSDTWLDAE